MLPKRLKQRRKDLGLTQTQLAEKVNTKKTTISNYETGYSTPSNEMLSDLADALQTTADYLLGRTDNDSMTVKTPDAPDLINDPDLQIAFKEAADFSEEARRQTIDFINYLKEKEKAKGRKSPTTESD
ncbi:MULTISPECIES: helix-turn-helix domain-containing protein [Bacillus subtilis group]|uniref:helix-turn-helix domain-containing protein n=1 Tax=Bacillus subtilis group TaxID=653685 RepID=UPI00103AFDDE|nr:MULTISPECIES: helix-turn-helix transcriptional regulator [Bacillus subtilis group]MEC3695512.1 helix-turn-helix transcriptional regulator [Bacillus subtilis]QBJ83561.1 transcriptional regulator [Bacillus subtilis subsp. subtilis]QRQ53605.1 helix-turn-helix transcriptional regulator [Bacillus subtilis]UZD52644.1 helix-turn-helix transcriptional regulator [Bacillus halotolerans]